jgi:ESF2/ABP1 family protein
MATDTIIESDGDVDFYSSDDENHKSFVLKNKSISTLHNQNDSDEQSDNEDKNNNDDDDDDDDSADDAFSKSKQKKTSKLFIDKESEHDNDDDDDDAQYFGFLSGDDEADDFNDEKTDNNSDKRIEETITHKETKSEKSISGTKKVKKLTAKQLEKEEKRIQKTGVVYLSSLPPYMKPQKLRQIMSRFGEVGRIFLKPEDLKVYKSRVKSGGNKKKKFDEGWVEFTDKKDAKLAANTLNGNILGGKKRSFYHDDVMNVKYLKGFKWFDLTNALNREVEVRESKKQAELSQAHKLNKAYIKNVETSKTINRVKESKKRKLENDKGTDNDDGNESQKITQIRRNFKQRNVATNRADAEDSIKNKSDTSNLNSVLDKIF